MSNFTLSMNTRCFLNFAPIFFLLLFINFSSLNAQVVVASDNASNSAYSGGWNDGTNGGTGFGAWSISIGTNTGRFIGSPAGDGMGTAGIGTSAFAFFASGTPFINATRNFNNAMQVGDVFTFYWATNFDPNGGGKGIDLRDASNNNILTLIHSGSSSSITYNGAATGTISTNYGTSPMLITVTRTSTTQYSISVTRRNTSDGTFSSTFSSSAAIARINLFHGNTNNGTGQRNPYFNNFQITSSAPTINASGGVVASSPGSGTSGYVGNTVTINGQNLNTVTAVKVGGSGGTGVAITGQTATTLTFTAPNVGGQIYLENPSGNTTSTEIYTNRGFISTGSGGNWNTTGTWFGASVPTTGSAVTVAASSSITLDVTANVSSMTINSGGVFNNGSGQTLTVAASGTLTNSGTFTSGTGTVAFAGAGTITGTIAFNNLTLNGLTTIPTTVTVNGNLTFNATGTSVTNAPAYGGSSNLIYAASVSRGGEWSATSAGRGYPVNVIVQNGATLTASQSFDVGCSGNLQLGSTTTSASGSIAMASNGKIVVAGNVNIGSDTNTSGSNLTLSPTSGGDIKVGGNWTRTGTNTFTPNTRAVFFTGAGTNIINSTGGASFDYVVSEKSGGSIQLGSNLIVNAPNTGNALSLRSAAGFDLNGNTLSLTNAASSSIQADGGLVNFTGTGTINFTSSTKSFTQINSGSFSFGTNVTLTTSTGVNFGAGLSTVNGTFQINSGGSVQTNAPIYGSSSTLIYNTAGTYGRGFEWSATTGAGYPTNVQISNSTTVDMGANSGAAVARQCAGNLTVGASSVFSMNTTAMTAAVTVIGNVLNLGTITLSGLGGGDLVVQGNITDNGTFNSNNRAVFFSGNNVQEIQGSGVFDIAYVRINKGGGSVRMLSNLTCAGPNGGNAMELNSSTSILDLNGFTLNLGQSTSTFNNGVAAPGVIRGSSSSTLNIFGTGALGTINFDTSSPDITNALQNLTINRTSTGTVTFGNTVKVGGTFTITAGTVGLTGNTNTAANLTLGTLGTQNTTWGSTSSSAARKDNSFFSGSGLITVSNDTRTTPSLTTPPTATSILIGDTLASSSLYDGVASVAGSFAFTTPSTAPTATGNHSVTFTPTDSANYNTFTTTVNVSVITSTTWDGASWSEGNPNPTMDAIINGTYFTDWFPNEPIDAKSLTVTASGSLTIATGTNVTVQNAVTSNGTMTIQNNANLIQVNNVANSGSVTVNRNGSTLKRLDYTLWSSPVASQNLKGFSSLTVDPRFYTYNEGIDKFSVVANPSGTTFTPGRSFFIRMPDQYPANAGNGNAYYAGSTTLAYPGVFTGTLNNGNISVTLTKGLNGYQAVGNPYPSVIDATAFINANAANIENTLYFWRKTNGASGSSYATWTLGGATSVTPTSGTPNGKIQVGQGFIVQAKNAGTVANFFTNAMRDEAPSSTQFFKVKQQAQKDRVWLNLTGPNDVFSQALVAYIDDATLGLDKYDGKYINDSGIALTTSINKEEYTIQARPAFDATDVVALNFKTSVAGTYNIAIDHVDGLFSKGQDIYLVDKTTGTTTNLNEGAYTFTAAVGVDNTRFTLTYQKTLKVDAPLFNENSVLVSRNNGTLNVKSNAVAINNVKVYDVQGRLVAERKNVKSNTATISNVRASQVLIVKVTTENNAVVTKKVLN